MNELRAKAFDLRKDIVKMVKKGNAGHIGGDLSVIDILTVLYYKHMNVSPDGMKDPERDRFILSKGHSVEALYAVLADRNFFLKKSSKPFHSINQNS
jgi:transketolase